MKVFLVQGDLGGSGFYRMSEPGRVAALNGIENTVNPELPVEAVRYRDGTYEVKELQLDVDVIVLQRPLPQLHHAVALAAKRQGIAIVADLDDDFHNVHNNNTFVNATRARKSPLENTLWLDRTLKLCDVITVSTPALLRYAKGRTQGAVVRNRIPEKAVRLPARPLCGKLGWTGTVDTHPEDLQQARGVLDQVQIPLTVVGSEHGVAKALQVPEERVELGHSWTQPVTSYWRALNFCMDVGIVPLESSAFNRAKSWLKGSEYIALGKPFIASPLPEYQLLAEESRAGRIATNPEEWAQAARELLEDGSKERDCGAEWAQENTLERHIDDWIQAWELAMKVRDTA